MGSEGILTISKIYLVRKKQMSSRKIPPETNASSKEYLLHIVYSGENSA